jgi:hypothetical protein
VHLPGEHLHRRIGLHLVQNVSRKGRSKEVACQVAPKKEHRLAAQRGGLLCDSFPIHPLASVDQLGNVADPT